MLTLLRPSASATPDVIAVNSFPTSAEPVMNGAPVGVMLTDWKVNVRVAIRAFENLPVP